MPGLSSFGAFHPGIRHPAPRAGSSDAACRHGLIWGHTVFHVVPNWRASPEIVAPSNHNCRIARRIARAPQARPGCAHLLAALQERHRLAGAFAAQPASLMPPDTRRNHGPGCIDHLHHHTPVSLSKSAHNPSSQHSDHRTLCRAPDHTHAER